MDVQLRIRRFNPETDHEPHWEEYTVEAEPTDRVLDLLHQVKWYQDGTLTFRRSCAHGVCGSDAMLINGRNRLACEMLVKDAGDKITVEAIRSLPVIKDLLVDMAPFWDKYTAVMPFLVNDEIPDDGKERRQSPADRELYEDTSKCILCAACTTACPVFWTNPDYVGPAAIVKDLLVDMDPFWDQYKSVMPFLVNDDVPPDGKERRQSPKDRERYEDTSRCILCAACTTSCPVFWSDQKYVGPAAIVNAHRFIVDSRDQAHEERLQIMADPDGVWRCRTTFNCVEACPRDIQITRAILEVTSEIGRAGIR